MTCAASLSTPSTVDVKSTTARCASADGASISSAADSLASPSASPGSGFDKPTSDGSGPSLSESFAHYDRATCSWRTSQVCFTGELETFSEAWPRAGMTRSGIAFQRQPLVPLTDATGCGFLPTPTVEDAGRTGSAAGWEKYETDGQTSQWRLRNYAQMWPTPRVSDGNGAGLHGTGGMDLRTAVVWPTPTRNDHKGAGYQKGQGEARFFTLPGAARASSGMAYDQAASGQLNPTWVEWLMGFPLGWTDCGPSATPSSRKSRNGSDAD